jgi:hypothetical protein
MKYIHTNKTRLSLITLLDGLSVTTVTLCAASQMHLMIAYKRLNPAFQQIESNHLFCIFSGDSQPMFRDKLWNF